MNPHLDRLQDYPFERLARLKAGVAPPAEYPPVMLSIGEPKHAPPDFVVELLAERDGLARDLAGYPATRGSLELREAIAGWIARRYRAQVDPETQVLPVAGTREALFSFGQAVLSGESGSLAVLPNPFYQIYEGAVLLRGAEPFFVNCTAATGYQPDYRSVPDAVWRRCELLYLCSPGNPTGTQLDLDTFAWLLEQADRHDFVIASDECYSEIYFDDAAPPVGLLEAAAATGRSDFRRCVVFHSLSKRSNLPGLRSGFVAGDAQVLAHYYRYRTYEGCALPNHVQRASTAAWQDEAHVVANRAAYRRKFEAVAANLEPVLQLRAPQGGFYHWVETPENDETFARALFAERNITVLPGSYLGRPAHGVNPGENHVRIAWVAAEDECIDAARRLAEWIRTRG
ncbi:MAG TPA: succinyldiaminopimelate transaminase [Pseudomonadales bacterium]